MNNLGYCQSKQSITLSNWGKITKTKRLERVLDFSIAG